MVAWPRADGAFAAADLAATRVFLFGMVLVVVSWGAEAGLTDRAAGLVARFAGGEPLADFAAVRLAPVLAPDAEAAGDLVAVRFTGSSVAVLALVAATYTPSVVTHFRLGLGVRNRKCLLCRMSALISA